MTHLPEWYYRWTRSSNAWSRAHQASDRQLLNAQVLAHRDRRPVRDLNPPRGIRNPRGQRDRPATKVLEHQRLGVRRGRIEAAPLAPLAALEQRVIERLRAVARGHQQA